MICLIPDPNDSEAQYCRYYHLDIPGLDDTDIIDELHALRPLLWWKLAGDGWLRERVGLLESELRRRKAGVRYAIR